MKKGCLLITGMLMLSLHARSQVGIGETEFLPDEAAMLHVKGGSTAEPRGLLIPRLDAAQETNLLTKVNTPAVPTAGGLLYYSTDKKKFMFYNAVLKKFLSVNPWTFTPDVDALYYNGTIGIGTATPDLSYKLDIRGGDVNMAGGLDVGQAVSVGQGLNVSGSTMLNGDVTLGDSPADDVNVVGRLTAGNDVVSTAYRYTEAKTRYYTLASADFEAYEQTNPMFPIPMENIWISSSAVYNLSTENHAPAYTILHLPDGAVMEELEALFFIGDEAVDDISISLIADKLTGGGPPSLWFGSKDVAPVPGSTQDFSLTLTGPYPVSNYDYVYRLYVEIPQDSNLRWVRIKYRVYNAD